jgi:stearoyl-CoA desaturase (delta-9 desaturase)
MYYPIFNLGQSIGYHKLFAHKAFKPNKWFPYLSAFVGSISFFGDPLRSAIIHRLHHKHADTDLDPHSPKHGRFYAYISWIYHYVPNPNEKYVALDLIRQYPWLVSYSKYEWLVFPIFHTIIFLLSPTLFLIIMLGCLISVNSAFILNAISHDFASARWTATNKVWLAKYINPGFLHKPHHENAGLWDYSNGEVVDFTRWFIKNWLAEDPTHVKSEH